VTPRPPATVSVDVDPVDLHLVGYGFTGLPPDPLVYAAALPRLVSAFQRHGIRATLFVVARDAGAQSAALRALAADGHEIGSHTFSHPLALASLPAARQTEEFTGSKRALERACGAEVTGFRAPNFDLDPAALERLAAAGYRYDASGYPTPVLAAARIVLALKGGRPLDVLRLKLLPFTWRRGPHRLRAGHGTLAEFPVSVTPGFRLPVYHTLRYGMSDARFEAILDGFVRRGEPLSYAMHGVDVLGRDEDRVDARLAKHPGMDVPLDRKLALIERTLAAIARRFEPATFAARLARGEPVA
jgi:hypothetical protein